MSSQHVVEFADSVRLTRLPPGRAASRIWLHFVVTGLGFNDDPNDPTRGLWRLHEHIVVTGEHGPLEHLGGGESSDGSTTSLQMELSDDGSSLIKIQYRDGGGVLGEETIDLPED